MGDLLESAFRISDPNVFCNSVVSILLISDCRIRRISLLDAPREVSCFRSTIFLMANSVFEKSLISAISFRAKCSFEMTPITIEARNPKHIDAMLVPMRNIFDLFLSAFTSILLKIKVTIAPDSPNNRGKTVVTTEVADHATIKPAAPPRSPMPPIRDACSLVTVAMLVRLSNRNIAQEAISPPPLCPLRLPQIESHRLLLWSSRVFGSGHSVTI